MMSIFKRFKGEKVAALPEVLNVTIGRSIEIEQMTIKLLPEDSLLDLESTTLSIVAQGHCDLGEGAHLHRFYPNDDSALIQMQGGNGIDNVEIDEIMLWTYLDVSYPSSDTAWLEVRQLIQNPNYTLENYSAQFERVWFDDSDEKQEPISYWETVHDNLDGKTPRRIFQSSMLYGRTLSDGSDEMLLINMEEPEAGDRCVSTMIGRNLTQHQFRV